MRESFRDAAPHERRRHRSRMSGLPFGQSRTPALDIRHRRMPPDLPRLHLSTLRRPVGLTRFAKDGCPIARAQFAREEGVLRSRTGWPRPFASAEGWAYLLQKAHRKSRATDAHTP